MPSMELYINDVTAATDLEDFFMADFRSASFLYLSAPVNFGHSSSNCIRNHLDLILQTKEDPQPDEYMYFNVCHCGSLKVIM